MIKLWDLVEVTYTSEPYLVGKRYRVTAVVKGDPDMYKLDFGERCWLASCLKVVKKNKRIRGD